MLLVIAERWARSSTSIATWTSPPSNCDIQGGTGASYSKYQKVNVKLLELKLERERGGEGDPFSWHNYIFSKKWSGVQLFYTIIHLSLKVMADKKPIYFCFLYLWVSFSSNRAKGTINNIDERSNFQIFFRAVAYKEPTTHTVHTELLLQFPFPPGLERSTMTYVLMHIYLQLQKTANYICSIDSIAQRIQWTSSRQKELS